MKFFSWTIKFLIMGKLFLYFLNFSGIIRLVPPNHILTPFFLINGKPSQEINITLSNFFLNKLKIKINNLENRKYLIGPDKLIIL